MLDSLLSQQIHYTHGLIVQIWQWIIRHQTITNFWKCPVGDHLISKLSVSVNVPNTTD